MNQDNDEDTSCQTPDPKTVITSKTSGTIELTLTHKEKSMMNQFGCTKTPEALFRETVEQHEKIIALEAEITQLQQQHTWQPIETYPTDGWPYALAKFNGTVLEQIDISESYTDPLRRLSELRNYTHWLAIPPLPQAKEKSHADD